MEEPKASASQPSRISFEDFIEATSIAVLRAIAAQEGTHETLPRRPIIIGIIYLPQEMLGGIGQTASAAQ